VLKEGRKAIFVDLLCIDDTMSSVPASRILSVLLPSYCGEVSDHIVCTVQLHQLVLAGGLWLCSEY
jgi:hypothetical protein